MICKFPLPYSSLSSLYFGISGKPFDWFYLNKNTKWVASDISTIDFNNKLKWKISHTSIILPHLEYKSYKLFLRLRLGVEEKRKPPFEYVEDLLIEHNVNDAYHFSVCSIKKENNTEKILLKKNEKWISSNRIHNIIL